MASKAKANPASVLPPPAAPVAGKSSDKGESGSAKALDINNPDRSVIDMDIFGQLLEMDDDDEHSFSKPLVEEYLEQAGVTLKLMEDQLNDTGDAQSVKLDFLSSKGHFLKGSSAALGLIQVRDSCEALQNVGKCKDAAGAKEISAKDAWAQCEELIPNLKTQHEEATAWLKVLCSLD